MTENLRNHVAKIIDPLAFDTERYIPNRRQRTEEAKAKFLADRAKRQPAALAKADAIIGLIAP